MPIKIAPTLPQELRDSGPTSLEVYTPKGWFPSAWATCKIGKGLGVDLHTFQKGREIIYNCKLSK